MGFYIQHPFLGFSGEAAQRLLIWNQPDLIRYIHGVLFSSLILICAVIDLRHMIIPDVISLPMIALTPLVAWMHPDLDMTSALIGAAAGAGFLYLIAWLYWMLRKEVGMGLGDVKLLGAIGGWLGYQALLPTILIASLTGSCLGIALMIAQKKWNLKSQLPFGPFLALGALMHLALGGWIQEWLIALQSF